MDLRKQILTCEDRGEEATYAMIKPGFLQHEKAIKERIEAIGAKIIASKKMKLNDEILAAHYAEHVGKEFYNNLCSYMKSGEVIGMLVIGKTGVVAKLREIVGSTKQPAEGTIRHSFGIGEITRNVIHASDSVEAGKKECERFFCDSERYGIK